MSWIPIEEISKAEKDAFDRSFAKKARFVVRRLAKRLCLSVNDSKSESFLVRDKSLAYRLPLVFAWISVA